MFSIIADADAQKRRLAALGVQTIHLQIDVIRIAQKKKPSKNRGQEIAAKFSYFTLAKMITRV
jgi:hypothetical protein